MFRCKWLATWIWDEGDDCYLGWGGFVGLLIRYLFMRCLVCWALKKTVGDGDGDDKKGRSKAFNRKIIIMKVEIKNWGSTAWEWPSGRK